MQRYPNKYQTPIMKYLLLLLALPFVSASECNKKDSLPACVQSIIDKPGSPDKPVQIDEYRYQDKRVFLFTAPCCDQYNTLYNEDCASICSPSGGITGKGDGKCPDFSVTATHVKMIWKTPSK